MSKAGKEHTDDPVEKHPGQVVDPQGGSPEPEGQYHGLTPDQVEKIEAAKYDDASTMPAVEADTNAEANAARGFDPKFGFSEPDPEPKPQPAPEPDPKAKRRENHHG